MVNRIKDVLKYGKDMLVKNDISTREARMLLALAMNISSNDLIKYTECTDGEYKIYQSYIERRCSGEPYAYIAGKKEFMKLDFLVNKNVLIPREDTEILVLEAIKRCPQKVLDMCTGSGCIAISLAKYINGVEVDAVDISSPALTVAKKNAKLNEVDVKFIKSDLFENVEDKYDMIVSNPPYIRKADLKELQKEVKQEPKKALDGGEDGLIFYDRILHDAKKHLKKNGVILFEIGYDQAKDVMALAKKYNYKKVKKIKDLSNNDRVIIVEG